ncbi:MAG: Sigma-E factor negative regulatory protein RseA [uncultured Thiotrichaceae bacterium]|uniref:Sigma-E factor negative regulatory protein RseA n=1 Tax=uncultured Thiotrichaceae bacterium TaxID=298394 RepID=A0A6S6TU96_9GAMM|nr:MAG: Sigma-E factor negative regulatory protein RseA [uncultured Thiotrichaceae bacterium]
MTKMTTKQEYLSALLDDEAGTFEQKRLLDEVQKDEELQQKLSSYALIGESLRAENNEAPILGTSFLAGIHDQLDQEEDFDEVLIEDIKDQPAANNNTWLKPMLGGALAASVVAVMAVTLMQSPQNPMSTAPIESIADNNVPVIIAEPTVVATVNNVERPIYVADQDLRNRLKRYVNNHVKYGSKSAIMPSVRAVGYAANY